MTNEQRINKALGLIGTIQYEIGKLLYEIKTNKLYLKYASHIHNWQDYLKDIGLTYNQAQTYIDVYETFPEESGELFNRMHDISKLHKFGLIKKENLKEVYEKSKSLTIKDWKDELNMLQGLESYIGCEHTDYETYIKCKRCGKWLKQ